jgi:hypothetical protein
LPVTIGIKSMNGLLAIKKLGIDPDDFEWLATSGIIVKATTKAFSFIHPNLPEDPILGANPLAVVPVTLNLLQGLKEGSISTVEKLELKAAVQDVIPYLKEQLDEHPVKAGDPDGALGMLSPINVVNAMDEMGSAPGKPAQPVASAPMSAFPTFDLTKLKSAPLTKLRDATMLYQPVHGTSSSSRYYLVAANQGLRVAARWKNSGLSIRVEGESLLAHKSELTEAGIILKGAEYASVHLSCDDELLARKAMGAVLMAMGAQFDTPLPNLMVIQGK